MNWMPIDDAAKSGESFVIYVPGLGARVGEWEVSELRWSSGPWGIVRPTHYLPNPATERVAEHS